MCIQATSQTYQPSFSMHQQTYVDHLIAALLHCSAVQLLKTVIYLALREDLCSMKDDASHQQN